MTDGGIVAIAGISLGHATDFEGLTGCTAILFDESAVGGMHISGFAAGTRAVEPVRDFHVVERVHGVLLSGGSSFGLSACGGVMRFLEERGIGFDTGVARIPLVPTAIIFDLGIGDPAARPGEAMGYAAAAVAGRDAPAEGCVGVGAGATVGKLHGVACATKSGFGTALVEGPGGVLVGAAAVTNAFGDVVDPETGRIVAGTRTGPDSREFADTLRLILEGRAAARWSGQTNTTLAAVATNAALGREKLRMVAASCNLALAGVIRPYSTLFDGDVAFAFSCGSVAADVNLVALMAGEAVVRAARRGVMAAHSAGGLPAARDLV